MSSKDNRTEPRKKTCLQAFASDVADNFDVKCIIRDVSNSGCQIVSSKIDDLPELIQLIPEKFDEPLNGKIVWRKDKMAGVSFLSAAGAEFVDRMVDFFNRDDSISNEEEPMLLQATARPLGYAERLARYSPRAKQ